MRECRWNCRQMVLSLITAVLIALIFANSLQPASVSSVESGRVVQILQSFLAYFHMPLTVSEYVVRKMAHFTEYTVLGVMLAATMRAYTNRFLPHIFVPLFVGLAVPVADECIQLFVEGRSGQVQDVVLDFAGVITGLLLTTLWLIGRSRWHSGYEKDKTLQSRE